MDDIQTPYAHPEVLTMLRQLITSSLFSILVFVCGCSTNPSTGRSQLDLVDSSQVAAMGEQAAPELIKEYGGQVESRELRNYVEGVGRKLARQVEPEYKDIKWEFITLDSDVINAFALPPGKVFVSRGLLDKLDNEAQVAAVLGHEIGHVTAEHVDERISHAMLVQGLATGASAAVGGGDGGSASQLVPLVVGLGGQGYLLKFGRSQESEADRQGLKYMTRAGYDPRGAADVMRVLIAADQGGARLEMLSTHPDPKRRLADVQELIRNEYSYTQDNPEYKKHADRVNEKARPYLRAASGDTGR
jgi:predicted Zn-dependent protease